MLVPVSRFPVSRILWALSQLHSPLCFFGLSIVTLSPRCVVVVLVPTVPLSVFCILCLVCTSLSPVVVHEPTRQGWSSVAVI